MLRRPIARVVLHWSRPPGRRTPAREGHLIDNTHHIGFAFDATRERSWGVYRCVVGADTEYQWYCQTFLEWLERLVRNDGGLLPQGAAQ